ncbi:transcriptional regulator [Guyparkeria halopsychrophila]|uniref:transcriptional regulator n=1 Tax=Guyparkeria halopsychrophila TaxID=3139421 RepID=UPI0037C64551
MSDNQPFALARAVDLAGSQSELARRIGVDQPHIWNWLNRGRKRVPGEYVIPIEEAVGGAVTRQQLRPDLYPESDASS